ncbi:beta-1,4-glucuronyltransferase 1 isoform X2 [Euwallacea similis]|uniref:beta-1,4-glucuronyltransferase 1 isoform X2 n=1 Tax=Euwallacea similis TaxID=1736056 RepID=UPI00345082A7
MENWRCLTRTVSERGELQAVYSCGVKVADFVKKLMFQGKWRLWKLSIAVLIFLTIYNVFLTVRLMYASLCKQNSEVIIARAETPLRTDCNDVSRNQAKPATNKVPNKTLGNNVLEEGRKNPAGNGKYALNLNLSLGRSDARLGYKLFDNVLVGEKYIQLSETYETCLATQSSLDKIASLIESSLYWGGPISLAAFAGSEKELGNLLLYILYLRKCNIRIREKVTFHIAINRGSKGPKNYDVDEGVLEKLDCGNPMAVLKSLAIQETIRRNIRSWRGKLPYPQNLLRNLARKNCQSKYVFLTDVDIIPSKGMAESLNKFYENQKCSGKCAYVVPTYELDERVYFPPNKTDLVRMANKGLARPFHHKVFIYNQYATNFSRWQQYKDPDDRVRISHPVTNFEFLYEPFYISTDNVPPHDERFVGYGYTRNSQVYEMFVAGYEFFVLSPIFTCHWGLQVKKSRPPWREHQNNLNRKQFDNFKKEIFARYNKDPLNMIKH